VDVVPAFTTVAVHFNPRLLAVGKQLPSVQLTQLIDKLLSKGVVMHTQRGQRVDVPVCYGGKYGPDLTEVAQACQLTEEQVIHAHTNTPLTLYAYFFSPGNPFAGQMDARIHVPRRQTPRTRVEAGSVAIANSLTSIYQMASPGGWNVIGRTPWNLFDVQQSPPTRFALGDQLHFYAISPAEFDAMKEVRT
jgi:inhibitor of KinA